MAITFTELNYSTCPSNPDFWTFETRTADVTTSAFDITAGTLLVMTVGFEVHLPSSSGNGAYPITITDTAGLTWTLRAEESGDSSTIQTYTAPVPSSDTGITVTIARNVSVYSYEYRNMSISIFEATGVDETDPVVQYDGYNDSYATGAGVKTCTLASTPNAENYIFSPLWGAWQDGDGAEWEYLGEVTVTETSGYTVLKNAGIEASYWKGRFFAQGRTGTTTSAVTATLSAGDDGTTTNLAMLAIEFAAAPEPITQINFRSLTSKFDERVSEGFDDLAGTVNQTTSSFTPNNNSLLVAVVHCQFSDAGTGLVSVSDSETLLWTKEDELDSSFEYAVMYSAQVTTGASMTVTADFNQAYRAYAIEVFEFTGHDQSNPIGLTKINNTGREVTGPYDVDVDVTFSSAPTPNNIVVVTSRASITSEDGPPVINIESGFTETTSDLEFGISWDRNAYYSGYIRDSSDITETFNYTGSPDSSGSGHATETQLIFEVNSATEEPPVVEFIPFEYSFSMILD